MNILARSHKGDVGHEPRHRQESTTRWRAATCKTVLDGLRTDMAQSGREPLEFEEAALCVTRANGLKPSISPSPMINGPRQYRGISRDKTRKKHRAGQPVGAAGCAGGKSRTVGKKNAKRARGLVFDLVRQSINARSRPFSPARPRTCCRTYLSTRLADRVTFSRPVLQTSRAKRHGLLDW